MHNKQREIAEKIRELRDQGMSKQKRYWHPIIGYNYRMTNVQAALGLAQLEKIDSMITWKRQIAYQDNKKLVDIPGITSPPCESWAETTYWLYSILIEDGFGMNRDDVEIRLQETGIDSRPFFYPIHVLPPYHTEKRFPVAERLSRQGINLPSAVTLRPDQVQKICAELRRIYHTSRDVR